MADEDVDVLVVEEVVAVEEVTGCEEVDDADDVDKMLLLLLLVAGTATKVTLMQNLFGSFSKTWSVPCKPS